MLASFWRKGPEYKPHLLPNFSDSSSSTLQLTTLHYNFNNTNNFKPNLQINSKLSKWSLSRQVLLFHFDSMTPFTATQHILHMMQTPSQPLRYHSNGPLARSELRSGDHSRCYRHHLQGGQQASCQGQRCQPFHPRQRRCRCH